MAASDVPLDLGSLRRILVRLPNWLGDVCMLAPALEALSRAAPRASLVAACKTALAPVAARLPGVLDVVALDRLKGVKAAFRAARLYREACCDAAIVVPRSLRAALPVALARIPVRVGFASELRSMLLTHPVRGWKPLRQAHRTTYFGALLSAFGVPPDAPLAPWRLDVPGDALAWADAFLAAAPERRAGLPVLAVEAGGAYGTAKRWPEERFAEVVGSLAAHGEADVVLVGTADAAGQQERIARLARAPVIRAAGRTDAIQLAAILARSRLLLTNDTGPMHLASAVGTPVVALFGSTDPAVCGSRGGPATVLYEKVACSPCYLRECPVPGHPCLDRLPVDRVRDAVRAVLAG